MLLAGNAAGQIIVCDRTAEAHLDAVACVLAAHDAPYLAAGPSGFFGHWIGKLFPRVAAAPVRPAVRSGLIVSGSRHPASVPQVLAAESSGLPAFRWANQELSAAITDALLAQRRVCLATSPETHADPETIAARLALITRAVCGRAKPDSLVGAGGDTTYTVLQALEMSAVTPCTELLPGIPLSIRRRAGRDRRLHRQRPRPRL